MYYPGDDNITNQKLSYKSHPLQKVLSDQNRYSLPQPIIAGRDPEHARTWLARKDQKISIWALFIVTAPDENERKKSQSWRKDGYGVGVAFTRDITNGGKSAREIIHSHYRVFGRDNAAIDA